MLNEISNYWHNGLLIRIIIVARIGEFSLVSIQRHEGEELATEVQRNNEAWEEGAGLEQFLYDYASIR